jgi:hypothetical protein
MHTIADTVEKAKTLLGQQVELVADLSFSNRATVARLATNDGATVIAKQHVDDNGRRNEIAALRVFPGNIAPALLASSNDIVVMEDLGEGPSVADLLLGNDSEVAYAALLAWARCLGQIAAATAGKMPIGVDSRPVIDLTTEHFRQLAKLWDVEYSFHLLDDELERAKTYLHTTSPYQTLVVSDAACPDNNRIIDGSVRMFDFEFATWSHPAIDAAYCLAPFCTCWCVAPLAETTHTAMFDAYCAEFSPAHKPTFLHAATVAGVSMMLSPILQISEQITRGSKVSRKGKAPLDTQQYLRFRLQWIADQNTYLPCVSDLASRILQQLNNQYPDTSLPSYPAFTPAQPN